MKASSGMREFTLTYPGDDGDVKTKFHCTSLSLEQEEYLDNRLGAVTEDGYQINSGTTVILALDMGLNGVEGLEDDSGAEFKIERDRTKKQICGKHPWKRGHIARIPKAVRKWLAEEIRTATELEEEEEKNS